ncbi:Hypothetical predicted protein [Lecanosticta acicola]|uniref:Uncharacterized protein n=1 Tax=Lecanosticta acicola TaxID=111012 RepID=A0AAI8Z4K4_9PEZI|nr:Hypothetical predicted protein [Lecanosticta acicola]
MHRDYQTLLLTSEPDDNSPVTYKGPPIGYGARVVQHAASSPGNESQIYGSLLAPRPLYVEQCETAHCAYCKVSRL